MIRRKGPETELDISSYGMGDSYADAFSEGIALYDEVEKINLSGNRLTERGALNILKNLKPVNIIELDLGDNNIGN
jgi:Leucine-rich repeat (LRR) protein